jgi:hypothetical protein
MKASAVKRVMWAARSDETNKLNGRKVRLRLGWWKSSCDHGTAWMLFSTRSRCRAWIKQDIRTRPDLQREREPHCWRVPIPVRVTVTVKEI